MEGIRAGAASWQSEKWQPEKWQSEIWDLGQNREHTKSWDFGNCSVLQIPVLQDNYSYLLCEEGRAVAIDPADDPKILQELKQRALRLHAIWNTHSHHDHVGGNRTLIKAAQNAGWDIEILGFSQTRIPELSREIRHGDLLSLGKASDKVSLRVYEVPGHTQDHLAFACEDRFVFSGDALFSLGCGRLFEGSPEQLVALTETFLQFGEHSLLFCAHEYTRANLGFALSLEPDNPALQGFAQRLSSNSNSNGAAWATVPSKLSFEFRANPFLRLQQAEFQAAMAQKVAQWKSWSRPEQMAYIRKAKDQF